MDQDKDPVSEEILKLTLKIICLLTGENYIVVKKQREEISARGSERSSEKSHRTPSPPIVPLPGSLVLDGNTRKEIMKLTSMMTQLLDGELAAGCEVDVSLSVEEWEEGRKVGKRHRSFCSLDGRSKKNASERWSSPHYTGGCVEEDTEVPQDYQTDKGDPVLHIQLKEEEIPVEIIPNGVASRMKVEKDSNPSLTLERIEEDHKIPQSAEERKQRQDTGSHTACPAQIQSTALESPRSAYPRLASQPPGNVKVESKTMRELFFEKLTQLQDSKAKDSKIYSQQKYYDLIRDVKQAKVKHKKEPVDYRRLARYDIIVIDGEEKLIEAIKGEGSSTRYFLYKEELFDVLHDTHLRIGHGGRTRMEKELQGNYTNITKEVIMTYLTLCKQCQQKHSVQRKALAASQKSSSELNSRCQVDLIDMESNPDSEYTFILKYQDQVTKFSFLRPLRTKKAAEVAGALLDIFAMIGAPSIRQSARGREFSTEVITELGRMWPELRMVSGKGHQNEDAGEPGNQEVQEMVASWMKENKTTRWAEGLRFIQLMKNRTYHAGVLKTPQEAMFGCKAKMGLASSSSLPKDVVENLKTEEELELAEAQLKNCPKKLTEILSCSTKSADASRRDNINPSRPVCEQVCPNAQECSQCKNNVLRSCSVYEIDDHNGLFRPRCPHCNKDSAPKRKRSDGLNLKTQSSKMLRSSDPTIPSSSVEDYVTIKVLEADEIPDAY